MELTKKFLPGMVERKHGRILNVASTAAYEPGPLMSVYYASKAFVLSFSHAIANELRHTGVTVTTLSPGPTRTNFVHESNLERSRLSRMPMMTPEKVARIGYKAMMRGDTEVVAGFYNKIMAFATRLVPRTVTAAIARRVQEKTNN
jgi:short-subunit dehydrogenase